MPIYEYQCAQCGHQFETLQKVSDEPLRVCPACGRESLDKLISESSFKLTGGGWYKSAPVDTSGSAEKTGKSAAGGEAPKTAGSKKAGDNSSASTTKKED